MVRGLAIAMTIASVALIAGCGTPAGHSFAGERIVVQDRGFAVAREGRAARPFIPWGFNYDRTVVDGKDMLLEDVMAQRPQVVAEDFAAMRRLGGNCVRIFIATSEILAGPDRISPAGLQRLDRVLDMAAAADLKVILVGLATLRPASIPDWMRAATDEELESAEVLFWQTVARACRGRNEIFTYDLQNEPVVHWSDSDDLIVGCFDMPDGQRFCYVHQHCRRISAKWTHHIQTKCGTEEAIKAHWPDYPRAGESWDRIAVAAFDGKDPRFAEYAAWNRSIFAGWAKGLASAIRSVDDTHLITVGALDPAPLAEAVDFYCYHLYPPAAAAGEDFLAKSRTDWHERLGKIPRDKPLVIEEFFPMWKPADVPAAHVLDAMLDATHGRACGWVSFYWGPPDRLTWTAPGMRELYESWLAAWSAKAPE